MTRLLEHKHNILHNNQYGFRIGSSTSDAMVSLVESIKSYFENDRKCVAVFLDLAKAFDTVHHHCLLEILNSYGVRGVVFDFFSSYLTNRVQILKYNNVFSDSQKIQMGVSQGTVLGPILFIVYINFLLETDINGISISYADDTVLIFDDTDCNLTKQKAQNGLKIVETWLDIHKLILNTSKTKYIAFSITNLNIPQFNSLTILETNHIKNFGITLDEHLKWTKRANDLTMKINRLIHKFYILQKILNKKMSITVYKVLVESLLRYGILVWGAIYDNALRLLKVAQNYILKIMFHKKKMFSTDLLYSEDILNIRQLFFLSCCVAVHKSSKSWIQVKHVYETRASVNKNIVIPHYKKALASIL